MKFDKEKLARRLSHEDMVASSAISYASGGACLALVLLLSQIWSASNLLHFWSLTLACVAMPIFVGVAIVDQMWGNLKLSYLDLQRFTVLDRARGWTWFFACLCLLVSVACMIFSMSTVAGGIFVVCSLLVMPAVLYAMAVAAMETQG